MWRALYDDGPPHGKDGDPVAVPAWSYREDDEGGCKCIRFRPRDLATRPGFEDAAHTTAEGFVMTNRCRFFAREKGCKYGDACKYCHVHPIAPKEPDGSQVVPREDGQGGRKLHRHERKERQAQRTHEREAGQRAYSVQFLAARQDVYGCLQEGKPVQGCQMAFWTIHRLASQARTSAADTAAKLQADGVSVESLGQYLGCDKLCEGQLHYPLGEAHGVHTLMKGLAYRLETLAMFSLADDFIIFESDATVVHALGGNLGRILALLRMECRDFCWLGFFTDAKKKHEGIKRWKYLDAEEAKKVGQVKNDGSGEGEEGWHWTWVNWPFQFFGQCTGNTIPDFGCQMFYLTKRFIPTFCERLRQYDRPLGLDMAFFDPALLSHKECAFLSHSICGQRPGQSDSWGKINFSAGEIKEFDISCVSVRDFEENDKIRQKREQKWQWVSRMQKTSKEAKRWRKSASYTDWRFPYQRGLEDSGSTQTFSNAGGASSSSAAKPAAAGDAPSRGFHNRKRLASPSLPREAPPTHRARTQHTQASSELQVFQLLNLTSKRPPPPPPPRRT